MPPRGTPAAAAVEADLRALQARHAGSDGALTLRYTTVACLGQLG